MVGKTSLNPNTGERGGGVCMEDEQFQKISLQVPERRFRTWEEFTETAPEYSIALEVLDDAPGHRGHYVNFDHHSGVIREATMSAAMQAYIAVRQGRLMERWLRKRKPVPVYVWNADQDVCLAAFVLEYHELLERAEGMPMLRWIVQYNNKLDVCGGLYPVNLDELVKNHFTWVFEPYRQQRMLGKMIGDEALVKTTIRQVCDRLAALLEGHAGITPITAHPEILYSSPYNFVIADEKGDPASRLVLAAQGYTNLISLICKRPNGRFTYSIIRGSSYDEDIFQIPKLMEAFQAAEDQPDAKIWGGSNLAAGSDSELGSSLHWRKLLEIAEPIVRQAYLGAAPLIQAGTEPEGSRPKVLLAMDDLPRNRLKPLLEGCGVEVLVAGTCAEACRVLEGDGRIRCIFCSQWMCDGSFTRLAQAGATGGQAYIPTIVCLPEADGGYTDLLESGAFQILVEPYDPDALRRLVGDCIAPRAAELAIAR